MDGKHLSTKMAKGYIGAYFGIYTYSKAAPAKATFDWVKYKKMNFSSHQGLFNDVMVTPFEEEVWINSFLPI